MIILTTIKASLKIDKEGLNNCPPKKELEQRIKKMLSHTISETRCLYTDAVDQDWWKNDGATLVLEFVNLNTQGTLELTKLVKDTEADEFDYAFADNGNVIVRLWWD